MAETFNFNDLSHTSDLNEWMELIGSEQGENTTNKGIDEIVLQFALSKDKLPSWSPESIPNEYMGVTESTSKLGLSLLVEYSDEMPVETFSHFLDTVNPLSTQDKQAYINKIITLVDQDAKGNNPEKIIPTIAYEIFQGISDKYSAKLAENNIDLDSIKEGDAKYPIFSDIRHSLKEDLDSAISYSSGKIDDNNMFNPKGQDISGEEYFKSTDACEIPQAGQVIGYANNNSVGAYVAEFGLPVGMKPSGIRGEDGITLKLFYEDGACQVAVEFQNGLSHKESDFMLDLAKQIEPIDSLKAVTGKAIGLLETYHR